MYIDSKYQEFHLINNQTKYVNNLNLLYYIFLFATFFLFKTDDKIYGKKTYIMDNGKKNHGLINIKINFCLFCTSLV